MLESAPVDLVSGTALAALFFGAYLPKANEDSNNPTPRRRRPALPTAA